MENHRLYEILTNFRPENLEEFGLEYDGEFWSNPELSLSIDVNGGRLIVHRGGVMVNRLNADTNDPVSLYNTFVETGLIEPAQHLLYLREQGINVP